MLRDRIKLHVYGMRRRVKPLIVLWVLEIGLWLLIVVPQSKPSSIDLQIPIVPVLNDTLELKKSTGQYDYTRLLW